MELIEGAPDAVLSEGWLVVNVQHPSELERAMASLLRPEVIGVRLFTTHGTALWDLFRARYRFVAAAGGAVQDEHGRLLVIRRLGLWDLPKGKVDPGEGVADAAVREVQEECGLRTLRIAHPLPSTWHTYMRKDTDHLKRTDWFLMEGRSDEALVPQHDEGIEEVRWAGVDEVRAMLRTTYPSLRPVLEAWLQQAPS